jgi:hypothetical protein
MKKETLNLRGPEALLTNNMATITYEIKLDLSTGIEDSFDLENSIFK